MPFSVRWRCKNSTFAALELLFVVVHICFTISPALSLWRALSPAHSLVRLASSPFDGPHFVARVNIHSVSVAASSPSSSLSLSSSSSSSPSTIQHHLHRLVRLVLSLSYSVHISISRCPVTCPLLSSVRIHLSNFRSQHSYGFAFFLFFRVRVLVRRPPVPVTLPVCRSGHFDYSSTRILSSRLSS